jgi:hypothetical protein
MQFFPLVDLQHWVLAIFLGLIALILVSLAFGSHTQRRGQRTEGEPEEGREQQLLLGQEGEKNPVAPLLIFIYIGVIVFAVAYLITIGIHGRAF